MKHEEEREGERKRERGEITDTADTSKTQRGDAARQETQTDSQTAEELVMLRDYTAGLA